MLPIETNIKEAYANGSDDEQNFIQNLSLFLYTFFKEHVQQIEKKQELNDILLEVYNHIFCEALVAYESVYHSVEVG